MSGNMTDLPHPLDIWDECLPAQHALSSDFKRHAGHLVGQSRQLRHHGIDSHLEIQHLTLHVDVDGAAEVAERNSLGDFRDGAHLVG